MDRIQGMMFIQKYYRSRNKNQEAEFNLARAFHQLGPFPAFSAECSILNEMFASFRSNASCSGSLRTSFDYAISSVRREDGTRQP